jgi:hypothetical protein
MALLSEEMKVLRHTTKLRSFAIVDNLNKEMYTHEPFLSRLAEEKVGLLAQ